MEQRMRQPDGTQSDSIAARASAVSTSSSNSAASLDSQPPPPPVSAWARTAARGRHATTVGAPSRTKAAEYGSGAYEGEASRSIIRGRGGGRRGCADALFVRISASHAAPAPYPHAPRPGGAPAQGALGGVDRLGGAAGASVPGQGHRARDPGRAVWPAGRTAGSAGGGAATQRWWAQRVGMQGGRACGAGSPDEWDAGGGPHPRPHGHGIAPAGESNVAIQLNPRRPNLHHAKTRKRAAFPGAP
eukprot:scaffold14426_cov93-Isochrysis_galbana.AAC.1